MSLLTCSIPSDTMIPTMIHIDPRESVRLECGRLMHAAIINKRFAEMLLANPVVSIEKGYCGEKFSFPQEFKDQIKSIRAFSLEDFAIQLMKAVELPVVSEYACIEKS